MRRSILLVALLVVMSFPSVEAFAATETIVQKGANLGDLTTAQGQMKQHQNFMQVNEVEASVKGSGSKNLIAQEEGDGDKIEPYPHHLSVDDDNGQKGERR